MSSLARTCRTPFVVHPIVQKKKELQFDNVLIVLLAKQFSAESIGHVSKRPCPAGRVIARPCGEALVSRETRRLGRIWGQEALGGGSRLDPACPGSENGMMKYISCKQKNWGESEASLPLDAFRKRYIQPIYTPLSAS